MHIAAFAGCGLLALWLAQRGGFDLKLHSLFRWVILGQPGHRGTRPVMRYKTFHLTL
jgi:hypothetical protein